MKTDCKMLPVYVPQDMYNEAMLLVARLVKTRKPQKISRNKNKPAPAEKIHKVKTSQIGCQTDRDLSKQDEKKNLEPELDRLRRELAEAKDKLSDVKHRISCESFELDGIVTRLEEDVQKKKVIIARGKATLQAETQRANAAEAREKALIQQLKDAQLREKQKPVTVVNNHVTKIEDRRSVVNNNTKNVDDRSYVNRSQHLHIREGESYSSNEPSLRQDAVEDVVRGGAIQQCPGLSPKQDKYLRAVCDSDRISSVLKSRNISKGEVRKAFANVLAEIRADELAWCDNGHSSEQNTEVRAAVVSTVFQPDNEGVLLDVLLNLTGKSERSLNAILEKYAKYA